ncbi:MAG: uracil-DNA glycosylase [Pseudomonadota bacterium]
MTNSREQQRRAYLDALGIDVFVRRQQPDSAAPPAAVEAPAEAALGGTAVELANAPAAVSAAGVDFSALRDAVRGCTRCPLHETRTQTVFGVGTVEADWMIIGEAPGAEEDRIGEPFVGRAGKLLDEMLRAVGLSRETVFIANVLKCRPPGNRDPGKAEVAACRSYLEQQISGIAPRLILVVGRIAAQELLASDAPVGKLRGREHDFNGVPLVVTYHPAYLLRSPAQKAKAWEDLKLARRCVRGQAG